MRIFGLIILGLMLLGNLIRLPMLIMALNSDSASQYRPGYLTSVLMGTIGFTALIAFLFVRLLRKTE